MTIHDRVKSRLHRPRILGLPVPDCLFILFLALIIVVVYDLAVFVRPLVLHGDPGGAVAIPALVLLTLLGLLFVAALFVGLQFKARMNQLQQKRPVKKDEIIMSLSPFERHNGHQNVKNNRKIKTDKYSYYNIFLSFSFDKYTVRSIPLDIGGKDFRPCFPSPSWPQLCSWLPSDGGGGGRGHDPCSHRREKADLGGEVNICILKRLSHISFSNWTIRKAYFSRLVRQNKI